MDAALFTKMLSDQSIIDLKKLGYKYPQADLKEFVALLGTGFYKAMPLKDFNGEKLVYLDSVAQVQLSAAKVLLTPQSSSQVYGRKAMEKEILSTFTIEQIDTSRDLSLIHIWKRQPKPPPAVAKAVPVGYNTFGDFYVGLCVRSPSPSYFLTGGVFDAHDLRDRSCI